MKRLILLTIIALTYLLIPLTTQAQTMSKIGGDNQVGMAGKTLSHDLKVRVILAGQEPGEDIPNVARNRLVRFSIVSGNGSLSRTSVKLGRTGVVSTQLTLGWQPGITKVWATSGTGRFRVGAAFIAEAIQPLTWIIPGTSTGPTPNIWRKFTGENVNADVPDLVDYSYAGYKNGEESIPDDFNLPVFNVTDYGAIANDNLSDTAAIRTAVDAASVSGGIVFFPPGKYDVIMAGDSTSVIWISGDNVIIKGSGAAGSNRGGTTIKIHNEITRDPSWYFIGLFSTTDFETGYGGKTKIVGTFPKGTKHFDVENASGLLNHRFIQINGYLSQKEDFDKYSSRPVEEMLEAHEHIREGILIKDLNEIDRIEGDRVYVKAPVLTHLHSKFHIVWRNLTVGIGFEDLHVDGNLQDTYIHLKDNNGVITLSHTAHSWVRRCRFSNITTGVEHKHSYANTAINIIVDSRPGHYAAMAAESTYCWTGLIEDRTNVGKKGMVHGISVQGKVAGNVVWMVGGPYMKGPDTHGGQSRDNLFDLYHSTNHDQSGGKRNQLPHHLDGYTRWNNFAQTRDAWDLWTPVAYFCITQANLIGYRTKGNSTPTNAYVEHFGTHISPNSLYEGQLEYRLGYLPEWISSAGEKYADFFAEVYSKTEPREPPVRPNTSPVFSNVENTQSVAEDTLPGIHIGSPYTATDAEQDTLVYSLENADASSFAIHSSTGQLRTDVILDYETKQTYTILVKVLDGNGGEDSIEVTINVTDVADNHVIYGRTPQVVDAIVAAIPDITNEVDVTADHLSQIISLDILNKGIRELKSGDFSGLTSLIQLSLSNADPVNENQLTTLPVDIFSGLSSIQIINLSENKLKIVPNGIFSNLSTLITINLAYNEIRSLPSGVFKGLTNLRRFYLTGNKLTHISRHIFAGLTSLREIHLRENTLRSMPAGIFSGLTSLYLVDLEKNRLSRIRGDIFSQLSNLTHIILANNNLSRLPANIFVGLTELEFVHLHDNRVDPIELTVSIEKIRVGRFKAVISTAAPFDITVSYTVVDQGNTISDISSEIKTGKSESPPIIWQENPDREGSLTVDIATLSDLPSGDPNVYPPPHKGYVLVKSANLPLEVIPSPAKAPRQIPDKTKLLTNFPNPFNPDTWIPYQLAETTDVTLTIYNMRGVIMRQLSLTNQPAGIYTNQNRAMYWDGKNKFGESMASGMYFYVLKAGKYTATKKMLIRK